MLKNEKAARVHDVADGLRRQGEFEAARYLDEYVLHLPSSKTWWDRVVVPHTNVADANDEIAVMREDWQKVGEALGFSEYVDPETLIEKVRSLAPTKVGSPC